MIAPYSNYSAEYHTDKIMAYSNLLFYGGIIVHILFFIFLNLMFLATLRKLKFKERTTNQSQSQSMKALYTKTLVFCTPL